MLGIVYIVYMNNFGFKQMELWRVPNGWDPVAARASDLKIRSDISLALRRLGMGFMVPPELPGFMRV